MRRLLVFSFFLGTCLMVFGAQRSGTPIPPGERQADAVEKNMKVEAPMVVAPGGVTPAQLEREAAELNQLAGLVQKEIGQVNQGRLPNDLPKNLKRIQKLAHELGLQISQ